ncbi:hypothetical protein [Desulfotomaculum copahuensis]|uniref:hypothetical protein n=1 Tax=Desulfotomaculum copahuensis TaxID=1838280 RepID=UPI00124859C1|nr:hypothetical protein [Desulfotomaculum copahuensis]
MKWLKANRHQYILTSSALNIHQPGFSPPGITINHYAPVWSVTCKVRIAGDSSLGGGLHCTAGTVTLEKPEGEKRAGKGDAKAVWKSK